MALKTKLEQSWADRHKLIRHADQPKISFDKARLAQMYQASKCYKAGFCHCHNTKKDIRRRGTDALQFLGKLVAVMKQQFWSRTINDKKEKSPGRVLLEGGFIILHFIGVTGEFAQDTFFHIGFVNYKTWSMATMKLDIVEGDDDAPSAPGRIIRLRANGIESDFKVLVDAVRENFDLEAEYLVQFYRLLGNNELLPIDNMIPGHDLTAQMLQDLGKTLVWKGSKLERKHNKKKEKKPKGKMLGIPPRGLDVML